MKIHAINEMQNHSDSVKKNVALLGSVILRGYEKNGDIQLLEGSHRMAFAIELGLPVTIVLFGENEVIPHDCDDLNSKVTGLPDRSTVGELADMLLNERGMYNQAVYESDDFPNINIIKTENENGTITHFRLLHPYVNINQIENNMLDAFNNPFGAFPEKLWEIMFGIVKNVSGKNVLVLGNNESRAAVAFAKLGANITYTDFSESNRLQTMEFMKHKNLNIDSIPYHKDISSIFVENKFDVLYAAINNSYHADDLCELFTNYKKLLKPGGLSVTLDTHPFMNVFHVNKTHEMSVSRNYDDLRLQSPTGLKYWRFSDFTRWIPASGLKLYAFTELQTGYDLYDSAWYLSKNERLDDLDRLTNLQNNSFSAIPKWLVSFSIKH